MSKPILTIQIVGWNSAAHLNAAVIPLRNIPEDKVVIRYIDNASTDNSVEVMKASLPNAEVIELSENRGFVGAHNVAYKQCDTEFVLTHDPDVELNWSGIEELLTKFSNPKLAAVQGKLLRKEKNESGKDTIDSAGIVQTITLNGKERGAGEEDTDQYNTAEKIFAVTGACGLYRTKAINELKGNSGNLFDPDFFAYKDDVDLGWQLNNAGYEVWYYPVVVGTHARTLGKGSKNNWGSNIVSLYTRLASPRSRYSLRNYIWMIAKNVSFKQIIIYDIFITGRLFIFFCLSLFCPPLFSTWSETLRGLPNMVHKRVS